MSNAHSEKSICRQWWQYAWTHEREKTIRKKYFQYKSNFYFLSALFTFISSWQAISGPISLRVLLWMARPVTWRALIVCSRPLELSNLCRCPKILTTPPVHWSLTEQWHRERNLYVKKQRKESLTNWSSRAAKVLLTLHYVLVECIRNEISSQNQCINHLQPLARLYL